MTSSTGIFDSIPAKAISAAISEVFLLPHLTHGTSTKPATGIADKTKIFLITKAMGLALDKAFRQQLG